MPYTAGAHGTIAPSPWVVRHLNGVPAGGTVLDVACGGGRHLRAALSAGLRAVGIDRDLAGCGDLVDMPGVRLIAADLESGAAFPLSGTCFAGVVVTNYLWRPILPDIVGAVAEDGLLIYETFAVGHQGRPSRPEFLLRPGELVEAVAGRLVVMAFEHIRSGEPFRAVQRIAAVGQRHPWLSTPPAKG
ncbi:MAG: class I SAM-dependent methyltransferase [Hyphomicrobiaceae bacterium]|nr:class I SAM-dependent methyltransferase [Hyphomicrobiaceae bacterium]